MSNEPDANLYQYLEDAVRILRISLNLARHGEVMFYRVIALQLRLLLCDTTRRHNQVVDISLVPRLYEDFQLRPFSPIGVFDITQPSMALKDWLEQPLPLESDPPLTMRQLIRRVCDQDGGAHVDPKPNAGLPPGTRVQVYILEIGEYLAGEMENMLDL